MTIVYLCLMPATNLLKAFERDGRRLRSLTSQTIIVDAMMKLIQKGTLEPTAQEVADAAGIGIRTVFRHLQDKESLFLKMDERVKDSYDRAIIKISPEGGLSQRIRDLFEKEAKLYEAYLQFIRATLANKWKYKTLQDNYEKNQINLKSLMYKWLPEIKELDVSMQIYLTSINSTGYWIELRENQMLSAEEAKQLKVRVFEDALLRKKA